MWKTQFAVYLGQESDSGFSGLIAEGNFFIAVEVEEGLTKEQGRSILTAIKTSLAVQAIDGLGAFETAVSDEIKKHNLPTGLSLSAGYLLDNIFYFKTINQGVVFVRRNKQVSKVIDGDKTASGYVKKNDFFVLTTNRFVILFGENQLSRIFDHQSPGQIVEALAPAIKTGDDRGVIAVFVQIQQSTENLDGGEEKKIISRPMILEKGRRLLWDYVARFKQYQTAGGRKRTLTLIFTAVIITVLFWSVGLGVARRNEAETNKKVSRSRELIRQKLDQAEEVAFLNLSRSQILISEVKEEFDNLKKGLSKKQMKDRSKEIEEIEQLIKEKENKIVKKEEKKFDEFFDLTVDNKQAQGSKLYLDGDNLLILDKNQGSIYRLSLTKKSLENFAANEIKQAVLLAGSGDKNFFYVDGKGVYQIAGNGKPKTVIDEDKDWGKIAGLFVYNGNIYLLDREKNQVYKYLSGEEKYGSKTEYFKSGESINLEGALSMAIDSSIYIGFSDYAVKFTAGARDEFKTQFPDENASLEKIFTSRDLEKVYGWDKNKGAIYVLGKNGVYERQVGSSVFGRGSDMVVYDEAAYILIKEKIYRVNL